MKPNRFDPAYAARNAQRRQEIRENNGNEITPVKLAERVERLEQALGLRPESEQR